MCDSKLQCKSGLKEALTTEIKVLKKMEKHGGGWRQGERERCGVLNKFANTRGHHCCCPSIRWLSHNEQRVPKRSRFLPRKDPSFFFLLTYSLHCRERRWCGEGRGTVTSSPSTAAQETAQCPARMFPHPPTAWLAPISTDSGPPLTCSLILILLLTTSSSLELINRCDF